MVAVKLLTLRFAGNRSKARRSLQWRVCSTDVFIVTARRYRCRCCTAPVLMCLMRSLNQRRRRMCSGSLRPHVGVGGGSGGVAWRGVIIQSAASLVSHMFRCLQQVLMRPDTALEMQSGGEPPLPGGTGPGSAVSEAQACLASVSTLGKFH